MCWLAGWLLECWLVAWAVLRLDRRPRHQLSHPPLSLQHANHLEAEYGAGPHTISVPRMRPADGSDVRALARGCCWLLLLSREGSSERAP